VTSVRTNLGACCGDRGSGGLVFAYPFGAADQKSPWTGRYMPAARKLIARRLGGFVDILLTRKQGMRI
jgi:hypothetical protein